TKVFSGQPEVFSKGRPARAPVSDLQPRCGFRKLSPGQVTPLLPQCAQSRAFSVAPARGAEGTGRRVGRFLGRLRARLPRLGSRAVNHASPGSAGGGCATSGFVT